MGYRVGVSGRIRISEAAEADAVAALRQALSHSEQIDDDATTLDALLWDAVVTREHGWLRFGPDDDGDPKWSNPSNTVYSSLCRWATEGRIDVEGEDGERWAYVYADGAVAFEGTNGWDGSTTIS